MFWFYFSLLFVFVFHCNSNAQEKRLQHAFVLVDVSGSMRASDINYEAKQIIVDILKGNSDHLQWKDKKWVVNIDCRIFSSGDPILRNGSLLCIMPFGNKERCYSRKLMQIRDVNMDLVPFIEQNYPDVYSDALTYLQLAKAYTGSIAKANGLDKSYVIVYSDGMQEQTSTQYPYNKQENALIDSLDYVGSNSFRKIGVLSKGYQKYTFKITVYELTTYNTQFRNEDIVIDQPAEEKVLSTINIISPKSKSPRKPKEVKIDEEITVTWMGATDASVSVLYRNSNGKYVRLDKKDRVKINRSGNKAKINFYENGEYQVKISDKSSGDSIYISVLSGFPIGVILGILAIAALVMIIAKSLAGKKQVHNGFDEHSQNEGGQNKNNANSDIKW